MWLGDNRNPRETRRTEMTMPDVKKLTQKDYEYLIEGIQLSNTRIAELEAEVERLRANNKYLIKILHALKNVAPQYRGPIEEIEQTFNESYRLRGAIKRHVKAVEDNDVHLADKIWKEEIYTDGDKP